MLSEKDYKNRYQEMLRLTMKNKANLHHADIAKPVIKDFTKKTINTNFLSKQDKIFKQKYVATLQNKMNIGNIKDNSSNEIEQGVIPQIEDSRSQGERLNDKVLQQQICLTNCKNLITDPTESNTLFNMLNDDPDLLSFFNDHFPEIKAKYAVQKNIKAVFVIQAIEKMYKIKLKSNDVNEPLQTNEFYSVFPRKEILEALYAKLEEEMGRGQQGDVSVDVESVADSLDKIEALIYIATEADGRKLSPEDLRMIQELGLPPSIPDNSDISSIELALDSFNATNISQLNEIVLNSGDASPLENTAETKDTVVEEEEQIQWQEMLDKMDYTELLQEFEVVKLKYRELLENQDSDPVNINSFGRLGVFFEKEVNRRANEQVPVVRDAEQPNKYAPKVTIGELDDISQFREAETDNFMHQLDNTLLSIAGYENEYNSLMDELESFTLKSKDKETVNKIAQQIDSILQQKISPETTAEVDHLLPVLIEIANDSQMTDHEKVKTVEKQLAHIKPYKLSLEEEGMLHYDPLEEELINQQEKTNNPLVSVRPHTQDLVTPIGEFRLDGDLLYHIFPGEDVFRKMSAKQYGKMIRKYTEQSDDNLTPDEVDWVFTLPNNITDFKQYVWINIEETNRKIESIPKTKQPGQKKSKTKSKKDKTGDVTKQSDQMEIHNDNDDASEVYAKAMRNAGKHSDDTVNRGEAMERAVKGHGFAVSKKKSSKSNIINNIMKQIIAKR